MYSTVRYGISILGYLLRYSIRSTTPHLVVTIARVYCIPTLKVMVYYTILYYTILYYTVAWCCVMSALPCLAMPWLAGGRTDGVAAVGGGEG